MCYFKNRHAKNFLTCLNSVIVSHLSSNTCFHSLHCRNSFICYCKLSQGWNKSFFLNAPFRQRHARFCVHGLEKDPVTRLFWSALMGNLALSRSCIGTIGPVCQTPCSVCPNHCHGQLDCKNLSLFLLSAAPNLKGRPRKKKVSMCQRRDSQAQSGNAKEPGSVEARTPSKVTLSLNNKLYIYTVCIPACLSVSSVSLLIAGIPEFLFPRIIFYKRPAWSLQKPATIVFLSLFHRPLFPRASSCTFPLPV